MCTGRIKSYTCVIIFNLVLFISNAFWAFFVPSAMQTATLIVESHCCCLLYSSVSVDFD